MGSGVTKCDTIKEIECPENYDERSFQKILTIYNKIQEILGFIVLSSFDYLGTNQLLVLSFQLI